MYSDDSKIFTILGNHRTAVSFDYDQGKKSYSFEVQAINNQSPDQLSGRTLVIVNVVDLNDNSPFISPSVINLDVSEGTLIGSQIVHMLKI